MNSKVSIIILNWNGWQDTIECLESLYQITYPDYDVVLVDNGSVDESIEKIKEYAKGKIKVESNFFDHNPSNKPIKIIEYTREEAEAGSGKEKEIANIPSNRKFILIKNEKNYGFAEGNNIGMRYALKTLNPDYVLLLNNDTVVDREFLSELVKVAESDENIGGVSPKIYYYDYGGRKDVIWFAGEDFSFWKGELYNRDGINEIDKGNYEKIKEVDKLEGACILVKRTVLHKVGLLDPEYFPIYWEVPDLCFRISKRNLKGVYIPKAKIWHKVSASTGGTLGRNQIYYLTRNQFLFMKKNAKRIQKFTFLLYFFGFRFWFFVGIYILYHRNITALKYFLKGVKDGIRFFISFQLYMP
jgi:hypothetical protein